MHQSVIASSVKPLPGPRLDGYAILGSDFILNNSGLAEYGSVPSGGDGAYVSIQVAESGNVRIGTDDAGYAKIYMYRKAGNWAVGTSLIELAEYVNEVNWRLSIDSAQIRSFMLGDQQRKPHLLTPSMISQQLLSRNTAFKEITLILPEEEVSILAHTPREVSIERRAVEPALEHYQDALEAGVGELVGRLNTLLESQLEVRSDITGGRDSRVILAALMKANSSASTIGSKVLFRSGVNVESDWKIVEPLSRKYHLDVNRAKPGLVQRIDPDSGFAEWRRHDLGTYGPIYPIASIDLAVSLTGAAGGAHRSVYRKRPIEENVLARRHPFVDQESVNELAEAAKSTVLQAANRIDDNLSHFRLFRNRFHGGRNALRGFSFAPLSSRRLQQASNFLSAEQLARAQFFADLMFNLSPDLAGEAYDVPSKGWDARHIEEVTPISVTSVARGAVYGKVDRKETAPRTKGRALMDPYREAFDRVVGDVIASGLLPQEYVYGAGFELHHIGNRKFDHAIDGTPASTVILAGEALRLAVD